MTLERKADAAGEAAKKDAAGKSAEERFAEIRSFFLAKLEEAGHSRRELYNRPKPGDAREPTEEEVVRRFAEILLIPVNDICMGIQRAFEFAECHGGVVSSFRYCVPQIQARLREVKDARVGGD